MMIGSSARRSQFCTAATDRAGGRGREAAAAPPAAPETEASQPQPQAGGWRAMRTRRAARVILWIFAREEDKEPRRQGEGEKKSNQAQGQAPGDSSVRLPVPLPRASRHFLRPILV